MVPHQIYQALSQQRSHELTATARRHQRLDAAQFAPANTTDSPARLKNAVARLATLVRTATSRAISGPASSGPARSAGSRGPANRVPASNASRAKLPSTSTSTAGPMGCVA